MRPLIQATDRLRALLITATLVAVTTFGAEQSFAQSAPVIETPVAFDSVGRIMTITPSVASRLRLSGAPGWPVEGSFREVRLFQSGGAAYVLAVSRQDGSVARYTLDSDSLLDLNQLINSAVVASAARGDGRNVRDEAATGMDVSQPAGNAFVRNQTFLGLFAYGPATAAMLSNSGPAAATGGYFLAAGSAFFVAARTTKNRTVTRAQNSLASHAGIRGAAAGAAVAAIANASGGPGYGTPILAGAVGGTLAGFNFARRLSDGEAATSGLMADLSALVTLGIGGAAGAFERDQVVIDEFGTIDERLSSSGKATLGAAVATGLIGYAFGPRYARRASYNVTDGDATIAFTGAALGSLAALTFPGDNASTTSAFGVATAGLVGGFVLADRFMVRTADRTSANGTLTQLGALAGALMGGGVAAISESGRRASFALVTTGGALGLVAADRLLEPAPDAGPLRGLMPSESSSGSFSASFSASRDARLIDRVNVSLAPLATAWAMQHVTAPDRERSSAGLRFSPLQPMVTNLPVVSFAW